MELFAGSVEQHLGREAIGQFGMGFVEQALADEEIAGGAVQ